MDINLINPEINKLDIDYLYHFGIDTSMDLDKVFAGVKYVVLTSSNEDIGLFANIFAKTWYAIQENDFNFKPIYKTERYHLYKVGPVLAASYGVGMPSLSICLNEIAKLVFHLKLTAVKFLKFGPALGVGQTAGAVVVVDEALNTKLEPVFINMECGQERHYNTTFDKLLTEDLQEFLNRNIKSAVSKGKSITVNSFYDEVGVLTSALNDDNQVSNYTTYFKTSIDNGVAAIDLEGTGLAGFCSELKIPVATINYIVDDVLNPTGVSGPCDSERHKLAVIATLANYIKNKTGNK